MSGVPSKIVGAPDGGSVAVTVNQADAHTTGLHVSQTRTTVPTAVTMQDATTSTGNGTSLDVQGFASAVLDVTITGTAVVAFEGSTDDSNWFPILGDNYNDAQAESGTSATSQSYLNVAGLKSVRARVAVWVSGTVTVKGRVGLMSHPQVYNKTTLVGFNSSVPVIGNIAHDSTATGTNPVLVGGYASAAAPSDVSTDGDAVRAWYKKNGAQVIAPTAGVYPTGTTMHSANTGTGNGTSLDVQGYATAVLEVSITGGVATIVAECSVDDTTWLTLYTEYVGAGTSIGLLPSMTGSGAYRGWVSGFKSVRARIAANTGTVTITGYVSTSTFTAASTTTINDANGSLTGDVAGQVGHDAVATSILPLLVGGYASAAAPSDVSTDGDAVRAWYLRNGSQVVVPGTETVASVAAWTSATALNTTATLSSGPGETLLVHLAQTSTITAGAITFEGSYDGTNFITVPAAQVLDPATLAQVAIPYTLVASTNKPFMIDIQGFQTVRIKLSTAITGTATVTVACSILPYPPMFKLSSTGAAIVDGSGANQPVVGVAAADAAVSGNPVNVSARGSNTIPTAMSTDGDVTQFWANLRGMLVATNVPGAGLNSDPFNLKFVAEQQTTTQTSHTLLTPTAGKKICVTSYQLQIYGTTAGDMQVYFGTSTFSRNSTRTIFDGTFVPSTTQKPVIVAQGPFWAAAADDLIRITTSAALSYTISIWYYEV